MMLALILLLVIPSFGLSEEPQRPACNARTVGQFWPPEANQSRDVVRQAAQQGELQVCLHGTWKYKWANLVVNVRDLDRSRSKPASDSVASTGSAQ